MHPAGSTLHPLEVYIAADWVSRPSTKVVPDMSWNKLLLAFLVIGCGKLVLEWDPPISWTCHSKRLLSKDIQLQEAIASEFDCSCIGLVLAHFD